MIKYFRVIQAALVMFTRLPLGSKHLKQQDFQSASSFFPVAGFVIALSCIAIYWCSLHFVSPNIALLITLIMSLMLSGAIHEDGLADCCDGFFAVAGLPSNHENRAKILSIMKDSRVGSFAVLALCSIFILRWQLLLEIPTEKHIIAMFCLFTVSKFPALWIISQLPYAHNQSIDPKMSQDIQLDYSAIASISFIIIALLMFFMQWQLIACLILLLFITTMALTFYFKQRLAAYNGDCLGASEQISGVVILLVFAFYF